MKETPLNSEVSTGLSKTIHDVAGLCKGRQTLAALGLEASKQQNETWARTIQENLAYSNTIRELRGALQTVEKAKKTYLPQITSLTEVPFVIVDNPFARDFLGDILLSRMINHRGDLINEIDQAEEEQLMAKEMGLQEGWQCQQAKDVTLEEVVSAVLRGALRVACTDW